MSSSASSAPTPPESYATGAITRPDQDPGYRKQDTEKPCEIIAGLLHSPVSCTLCPVSFCSTESRHDSPSQQRDHDLVMAGDLVALSALERRALHDVHARPVMALHVEVGGHESGRFSIAEIARDGERFQEDLGHDHRAA